MRCSRCRQPGTDRQTRAGHIFSRRGQRGCSRFDRNTQESSGSVHSADRGEAGRLPSIRRKGEEEVRRRRGHCDEGITDKVPVGERAQRRCAEVAAFAGGSSRTTQGPDSRTWRGASHSTGGASRGQPIAHHHRGSATRERSVAIRGVPPTRRRKSSVGAVSDRPGPHVEQREPVQSFGVETGSTSM